MEYNDEMAYKKDYFQDVTDQLTSNWPFDEQPKRKPIKGIFFIDHKKTGDTIGQVDSAKYNDVRQAGRAAGKLARLLDGVIRYYEPSTAEREAEGAVARTEKQNNYLAGEKYRKIDNALPMWATPKWYDHK